MPTVLQEYHQSRPEQKYQILNNPQLSGMLHAEVANSMMQHLNTTASREKVHAGKQALRGALLGTPVGAALGYLTKFLSGAPHTGGKGALVGMGIGSLLGAAGGAINANETNTTTDDAKFHMSKGPEWRQQLVSNHARLWMENQAHELKKELSGEKANHFMAGFQKRADTFSRVGREQSATELIDKQLEQEADAKKPKVQGRTV